MPDDSDDIVIIGPGIKTVHTRPGYPVPEQCRECGDAIMPGINDTGDGPLTVCRLCYIPPCGCDTLPEFGPQDFIV